MKNFKSRAAMSGSPQPVHRCSLRWNWLCCLQLGLSVATWQGWHAIATLQPGTTKLATEDFSNPTGSDACMATARHAVCAESTGPVHNVSPFLRRPCDVVMYLWSGAGSDFLRGKTTATCTGIYTTPVSTSLGASHGESSSIALSPSLLS